MYRSLSLLAAGMVLLSAVSLHAEEAVLGQMYGSGVHAYFSRDYVKAHECLTTAIEGGSIETASSLRDQLVELRRFLEEPYDRSLSHAEEGRLAVLADHAEHAAECFTAALSHAEASGQRRQIGRVRLLEAGLDHARGKRTGLDEDTAEIAADFAAIGSAISPYRSVRDYLREDIGRFVEVYCSCPLEVLIERDVKGLYKKALAGEIENFTGVSDPYEEPLNAEVVVHTDTESLAESTATILAKLEALGYIPGTSVDGDQVYSEEEEQILEDRLKALGYL